MNKEYKGENKKTKGKAKWLSENFMTIKKAIMPSIDQLFRKQFLVTNVIQLLVMIDNRTPAKRENETLNMKTMLS